MKQARQLAWSRVQTTQIRALAKIAPMAGESQIFHGVLAAMLLGDDMFDVKRHRRLVVTMEMAVFALTARTCNDKPAQRRIHQDVRWRASQPRALAWRTETMSTACT